jgi:hypothetical protein
MFHASPQFAAAPYQPPRARQDNVSFFGVFSRISAQRDSSIGHRDINAGDKQAQGRTSEIWTETFFCAAK